jgi:dissimilatory sulfite reductase related protein
MGGDEKAIRLRDDIEKSHQNDGFVKSSRYRTRKNRGRGRTHRCAATANLTRNPGSWPFYDAINITEGGIGMPVIELMGKQYEVDEDGFLQELDKWNPNFAEAYAKEEGIEGKLTEEHWKLINYLRDYYQKFGIAPMIRKLCKETGFDLKKVYELFPSGPAKGACKLAGLAKPTGCV